jgi:cell division protein FtsB
MREFQERRRMKKLLHSRYAIAVLAIISVLLAHAVYGVYGKYEKSKEIASRMQADLTSLEVREKSLTASMNALDTEEGKEREIRDRFGAVKPGEKMIVLVDDQAADKSVTPVQKSWWEKFIGIFGF